MRFGFHVSISGGFGKIVARARERQCETIQIFSRNPRAWKYRPLDKHGVSEFIEDTKKHDIRPVFVHMPYLVNLASNDKSLFERSVSSLAVGLKRCARIDAPFLILHVGSSPDPARGLEQMSRGICQALKKAPNNVMLLLENTAGSGNELGHDFVQLRAIFDNVEHNDRLGFVFDTAHAFAAGYDLRTREAVCKTISEFDGIIGLHRLCLIHLNDSKTGRGSRRDRHWHIAKGKIGRGLAHILQHEGLQHLPFIMETPRNDAKEDRMNMRMAKRLARHL
ncbi:MAG: deoxyribonuclease IV [candidate division WOR-3 bacterium]|nr:MAG: deoxyribonuclease IV [candidate division WOR-3 bacterium]